MTRRTPKDNRPRLLTPEELAEQLGVTVDHLAQLRDDRKGAGPAYITLGPRTVRYLSSEVAEWDRNGTCPPETGNDGDGGTHEV